MQPHDESHMTSDRELSSLDLGFARFMEELSGSVSGELHRAAALVSRATRQGHVCLDLRETAVRSFPDEGPDYLVHWAAELLKSGVVGRPGEYKPLILDDANRLYLYRYWDYERSLAESFLSRASMGVKDLSSEMGLRLNEAFPDEGSGPADLQKAAAYIALTRSLCVISGGPGTGKTWTVAAILALKLFQHNSLRIKLAAPTGKAAARLEESISAVLQKDLECFGRFPSHVLDRVPKEASTIHRLLGSVEGSPYFIYNIKNKLPIDLLVIDEASMVDIALMSKLAQALPGHAGLILLGDRNQLASVEAGAVLGDICHGIGLTGLSLNFMASYERIAGRRFEDPGMALPSSKYSSGGADIKAQTACLRDSMLELRRNYRFGAGSAIGTVSRAVKEGMADGVIDLLAEGGDGSVKWSRLPGEGNLKNALKPVVLRDWAAYLACKDPYEMLARFDELRILCAVRGGPYGVERLNALAGEILREEGLTGRGGIWYKGRPVMITENDYSLRLFNGDVGIACSSQKGDSELKVFFRSQGQATRSFPPYRLPRHETVFAATVHKSQGSEFENVLLIMPERDTPILTRELLYTGITRAKKSVELWGEMSIIRTAVSRRIERNSGLRDALWKGAQ